MAKKSIVVTGAAGFVGCNVVRHLLSCGYSVHAVVRSGSNLWRLKDLHGHLYVHEGLLDSFSTLSATLTKIRPYGICHLATYGSYPTQNNTQAIIEANILRFLYLLEASREIPYHRFVVAGSSSEYGKKMMPMRENDRLEPNNIYAVAKAAVTHLAQLEYKAYHKPVTVLRLFSVYGPFEEKGRLVRSVIESCLHNTSVMLATGKEARDFVHIDDVSLAFLCALHQKKKSIGEVINIGTGKQTTIQQLATMVKKLTHSQSLIQVGAYSGREWDSPYWRADTRKAKKLLGWQHTYSLKKGLLQTINWYKTA